MVPELNKLLFDYKCNNKHLQLIVQDFSLKFLTSGWLFAGDFFSEGEGQTLLIEFALA